MSGQGSAKQPFISGGHMLDNPPLSSRVIRWVDRIYLFFGLYLVSLFALDCYGTAESSQFNIASSRNQAWTRPRWNGSATSNSASGGSSGGSGGGRAVGGSGSGVRNIRGFNDVQNGPVYKSGCSGR